MHRLERLAADLPSNPSLVKEIEKEVDALANAESCSQLFEIHASKVPSIHIFLCNILEKRIQMKMATLDLAEEVQFCTKMLLEKPTFQGCEVYSLLGLYCWPRLMPDFIDAICSLLTTSIGYQILLQFLEKVNTSTKIDEKRRSELKKAISIVYPSIESKFDEKFAHLLIPIFTELLKILPKNFNFTLVYKKAAECPDEVISFIIEGFQFVDHNRVSEMLQLLPSDQSLIQVLGTLKPQRVECPNNIFNYVFRALSSDPECFLAGVDFWQRIFSSKANEALLIPVLNEVLKNYIEAGEDVKEEADQHAFGFFSIISKNFPASVAGFLGVNGNLLPQRIAAHFIQKLAKAEDGPALLSKLQFESPYLTCLCGYYSESPVMPKPLFSLSFADKESVKVGMMVLEKYSFTRDELVYVLSMCEGGCLNANEIKANCYVKLGVHEKFGANWSIEDVIKYYYYLKLSPGEYGVYRDYFYSLFVQNAPFDRCFSIVEKLGCIPIQVQQCIYEKMDKYSYTDLSCFNGDLLGYLQTPQPYIEKEVARLVSEWNTITDHKEFYLAAKSLLTVLAAKIETHPIIDSLLDLLQIDSSVTLGKVLSILSTYKGSFNTSKAVYYLICGYNNPNVADSHAMLSGALTDCMMRADGPSAFHSILGVEIGRCCGVRDQILKVNRKTAQGMVRDLIKDFKGKPFSKMFESEVKVTKQNILPVKVKEEADYDLKDVSFI